MFKFDKIYLLMTALLFLTEVLIALYLQTGFVRAYGGDFLVVIFLYCFVNSFFNTPKLFTAVWVLLFAYVIEISQYFHLVSLLGLQQSQMAKLVLGTTFSLIDMLTYTLGILLIIITETLMRRKWKAIL